MPLHSIVCIEKDHWTAEIHSSMSAMSESAVVSRVSGIAGTAGTAGTPYVLSLSISIYHSGSLGQSEPCQCLLECRRPARRHPWTSAKAQHSKKNGLHMNTISYNVDVDDLWRDHVICTLAFQVEHWFGENLTHGHMYIWDAWSRVSRRQLRQLQLWRYGPEHHTMSRCLSWWLSAPETSRWHFSQKRRHNGTTLREPRSKRCRFDARCNKRSRVWILEVEDPLIKKSVDAFQKVLELSANQDKQRTDIY